LTKENQRPFSQKHNKKNFQFKRRKHSRDKKRVSDTWIMLAFSRKNLILTGTGLTLPPLGLFLFVTSLTGLTKDVDLNKFLL